MGHRAAMYRVRVRRKREVDAWRLLGDFDEEGGWLGDFMLSKLSQLARESRDGKVRASFEGGLPSVHGDFIGATFLSGRSGVTSVLVRDGKSPYPRTPAHFEQMRTGILLHLPRGRKTGLLAVHVPEGRSIKGIIERYLEEELSRLDLMLSLDAVVPHDPLIAAVEQNAIERVTLVKHRPSSSDKFREAAQWGDDEVGELSLSIGSRRFAKLRRDPLKRFLTNPSSENKKTLYTFRGMEFDEVGVTVDLPDGGQRTYYVEPREGGHPMTMSMQIDKADEYGAIPATLSRELRAAIHSVASTT